MSAGARNWYYLSEMAISARHGGGLTLQRVLGDDLCAFSGFVHVHPFATKEPILDALRPREINLHVLDRVRRPPPDSIADYRERIVRRLRLERLFPDHTQRWYGRWADHLAHRIPLDQSAWLVVPQGTAAVGVMNRLYRRSPVPYVSWMMDDHVVQWSEGWRYPRGFEDAFAHHLRNAVAVFVISRPMADLYRERFGVESQVLFGPAIHVADPVIEPRDREGPLRLGYFGAIRNWQREGLERLASRLGALDATLDLFSFGEPGPTLTDPRISRQDPLPADEVRLRMREYDAVITPVSFGVDTRGLGALNIATKLSECLASGTVTVVVGPEYAAMVQFVHEHGGAVAVTDVGDPVQLARVRSLKDPAVREPILRRAHELTVGPWSAAEMHRRWARARDQAQGSNQ